MPPIFAALVLFAAAAAAPPPPAPAPVQTVPAPVVRVVPKAAPPSLGGTLGAGGFGAPLRPFQQSLSTPLQGLPSSTDASPQCRAACTKSRAICGDEQECSDQWRQCLTACASPSR